MRLRHFLTVIAISFGSCAGTTTAGVITSDSFDRPNSPTLGSTDNALGGTVTAPWQERAVGGASADTSDILDGRLRVFGEGVYLSTNSNPGFAVVNHNMPADYLNVSMDVRFGDLVGSGSSLKNAACLRLRMPGTSASVYDNGEIHVQFGPNGYLSLRERASSTWNQLYNWNPFTDTNTGWNVGSAGSLPSTFGGMPFDVDGNGTLDFDEPFTLDAILYGTELNVLLNGVNVATVTASAAPGSNNYFSFGKNRVSSGNTLTTPAVYFDNLVMVPEPGSVLMLLAGGAVVLATFRRKRRNPASVR